MEAHTDVAAAWFQHAVALLHHSMADFEAVRTAEQAIQCTFINDQVKGGIIKGHLSGVHDQPCGIIQQPREKQGKSMLMHAAPAIRSGCLLHFMPSSSRHIVFI